MQAMSVSTEPRAHEHPFQRLAGMALLALALPLMWWAPTFQVFPLVGPTAALVRHAGVEVFAVVVAILVFITGYRAVLPLRQGALLLLGIAYLGVGLLDFMHMMSYLGYIGASGADAGDAAQRLTFFWLMARLLAAGALLAYVWLPSMQDIGIAAKRLLLLGMLCFIAGIGVIGLHWSNVLPDLLDAELRPTWLKTALDWLTLSITVATLVVLWLRRKALLQECVMALAFAAALSATSGLFFSIHGGLQQHGIDLFGHLYKVAAYLFLFHATVNESLRRPLERMQAQHLRERLILNAAPDGVMWVDQSGQILMANPAMETLSGYRAQDLIGQNVTIFLPEHLRARHAESMRDYFTTPHARAMGLMDLNLMRKDGSMLPVDISLGHLTDQGTDHAIAYIRDLTERKKYEESLRHQATHDELTGLPNRWLFRLQLNQAMARAGRSGLRVAVLFIDLDHFKNINDSFGHSQGDSLLIQVGSRMRSVLRIHDSLARQGGDEFAILLTDLNSVDEAVLVANKLLKALQATYRLQNQDVYSGGSVGLAFYPDDAQTADTLLRYADIAMYHAKQAGRGTYACYSEEMDRRVHDDMQVHARLKEALAQGTLELYYQPQVDVLTGEMVGAEALLRWTDAVLGEVPPSRFIPVAEATGVILPLSDWVLETACAQIAAWAAAGTPLRVAVNFSAQQFSQRDMPTKVRAALERTGAQAQWLDIEITEWVAMTKPEYAREQLDALVALGCRVVLDDFGTGYSSLSYLKALPVSKLKIDKSFMDGIPQDVNGVAVSRAIIALARSLGLTLVAEGVETSTQLAFLQEHGCEVYQGWLFAKAMTAEALTLRLQSSLPRP